MKTEHYAETCRVIVLGVGQSGLSKVMSILRESASAWSHAKVAIEYLPCVPVFDSYVNEYGDSLRYLSRVDYLGPDASFQVPGTLLSFFDEVGDDAESANKDDVNKERRFRGISGMAVGGGIENHDDIDKVGRFLHSMAHATLPVQSIQPSSCYESLSEELKAFKALTVEEKEAATKAGTMGPGKMAKFVECFAKGLIDAAIRGEAAHYPIEVAGIADSHLKDETEDALHSNLPTGLDPTRKRYSCRKCRLMLFGESDLQDPPHVAATHKFSPRKHDGLSSLERPCQSYFLHSAKRWMGDLSEVGGKLSCPRCDSKLGNWSWSGAQCSCGTWVVPAIQIPCSRVDIVQAAEPDYPLEQS